ncbi:MAG: sensor histidine kinase N-terminal domain-containing protein, partial [Mesorhizobium sp.]|nr:sensor histidine kinase N-terminal domain-containing protein [Mesorhizobium sp.]
MTRRLILALTAAVVVFWIVAAGIGMVAMNDEFDEVFDSALQETAQRLVPLIVDDLYQRDAASQPRMLDRTAVADHEEYLTYQVRDSSGRVLIHSHDAPSTPFDAPLARGFWNSGNMRIYTESAIIDTLFVQVADPLD